MFSSSFIFFSAGLVLLVSKSWAKIAWMIFFFGLSFVFQTPWEASTPVYAMSFYLNFHASSFWILCALMYSLATSVLQISFLVATPKSYILLALSSFMFFMSKSFLWFYIMFEVSVLPICYIVMASGYQPERLSAGFSLMLYTLTSSMPFLCSILILLEVFGVGSLEKLSFLLLTPQSAILILSFILCFFVKLPVYFFHMWLPKAHVEAPVVGSMILAAILLKLGSYGLIMFSGFFSGYGALVSSSSLGIAGMVFSSWVALRLSDLKMIIAYSSVGHMGMGILGLTLFSSTSWAGAMLMFVSHAFSSSGLFLLAYVLYERTKSRSILLTKGLLTSNFTVAILWFILMMMSLGAPPTPNFMSEVLLASAFVQNVKLMVVSLLIALLPAAAYTFLLYSVVQQSENSLSNSLPLALASSLVTLWAHVFLCLGLAFLVL